MATHPPYHVIFCFFFCLLRCYVNFWGVGWTFGVPAVSRGIKVRISQQLDVVAFWSCNLDVVVFQPWNLDVVAFCHLKKCIGITMPWVNCLRFSMSWLFRLGISMSCIRASTASFSFSPNLLCHIINVDM